MAKKTNKPAGSSTADNLQAEANRVMESLGLEKLFRVEKTGLWYTKEKKANERASGTPVKTYLKTIN